MKKIEIHANKISKILPEETRTINGYTVKVIPVELINQIKLPQIPKHEKVKLTKEAKALLKQIVCKPTFVDKALVVPLDNRNKFLLKWYEKTKALAKPTEKEIERNMIAFASIARTEKKEYECFPIIGFYFKNDNLIFVQSNADSPIAEKKIETFFQYYPKIQFTK